MDKIRVSTSQVEGILKVAKSLKFQVLLDIAELRALFDALPPFLIAIVSEPVTLDAALVSMEDFFEKYASYIEPLKKGELPQENALRRYFASVLTTNAETLYAMDVGKNKYLIKQVKPVIQLQLHHFFYSSLDKKFHPLIYGKDSVTWGLQISYPQVAQDPVKKNIYKVPHDAPNSQLFSRLGKWMRNYTRPTPFIVDGKISNEPIRIGKECFSWIAHHPHLKAKGIQVKGSL